jgi:hypothetical protein
VDEVRIHKAAAVRPSDAVGTPAATAETGQEGAGGRPTWVEWLTTTDHKKIGTLHLVTAFAFFVVGGVMALAMRAELARPGLQIMSNEQFNQALTMHGSIMLLMFAMPLFTGFANWIVPLQIGATIAIAGLSLTVWAHHMYTTGGVLLPFFAFMTFLIAVPTRGEVLQLDRHHVEGLAVLRGPDAVDGGLHGDVPVRRSDRPGSRRLAAAACMTGWAGAGAVAVLLLVTEGWWAPAVAAVVGAATATALRLYAAVQRRREVRETAHHWAQLGHVPPPAGTGRSRNVVAAVMGCGMAAAVAVATWQAASGPGGGTGWAAAAVASATVMGVFLVAAAVYARAAARVPRRATATTGREGPRP